MSDPLSMRLCQCARDFAAVVQHSFQRQTPFSQALGESVALDQLHHQVIGAHIVQSADMRVIEGRNGLGFALESSTELLIGDLDRDGPAQARVTGFIDLAHPAFAQTALNFIRPYWGSGLQFPFAELHQQARRDLVERLYGIAGAILREQRDYFPVQFFIGPACRGKKGLPLGWGAFPRRVVQLLNLLHSFGSHSRWSRWLILLHRAARCSQGARPHAGTDELDVFRGERERPSLHGSVVAPVPFFFHDAVRRMPADALKSMGNLVRQDIPQYPWLGWVDGFHGPVVKDYDPFRVVRGGVRQRAGIHGSRGFV